MWNNYDDVRKQLRYLAVTVLNVERLPQELSVYKVTSKKCQK